MREEGLLFIASLVCAWTIPASHARQWGSPLRQETTEKQLRPLERRIDESICESLLRPHIQKVSICGFCQGGASAFTGGLWSQAADLVWTGSTDVPGPRRHVSRRCLDCVDRRSGGSCASQPILRRDSCPVLPRHAPATGNSKERLRSTSLLQHSRAHKAKLPGLQRGQHRQ